MSLVKRPIEADLKYTLKLSGGQVNCVEKGVFTNSSPLDQLDPEHQFDEWEYILYIMTLSFLIEGKCEQAAFC